MKIESNDTRIGLTRSTWCGFVSTCYVRVEGYLWHRGKVHRLQRICFRTSCPCWKARFDILEVVVMWKKIQKTIVCSYDEEVHNARMNCTCQDVQAASMEDRRDYISIKVLRLCQQTKMVHLKLKKSVPSFRERDSLMLSSARYFESNSSIRFLRCQLRWRGLQLAQRLTIQIIFTMVSYRFIIYITFI